jgi:two-component system NarL family sensor kinase
MTQPPTGVRASPDTAAPPRPWVRLVDGGSAGRGRVGRRRPPSPRRVMAQFILANLAAVALLMAGGVWASGRAAESESLSDARTSTAVLATVLVEPALTDAVLDGDAGALDALDRVVDQARRDAALVRVKIWDPSGRIVYSDEPRLIDTSFGLGQDEREALRTGETAAEISDLTEPENRYERAQGVLLEVYRRISTPAGRPLLFETYLRYDDATARQRQILLTFAPISVTALLLLLLVQLPLGDRMVRQLREGEAERLGLQARTADASTDERRRIAGSLHDGIVQDLAAASYVLSGASDQLAGGSVPADKAATIRTGVRAAEGAVRGSVAALRSLLIEIYPPHLAQSGLPSALRGLAHRLQPRGVTVRVDVPDEVDVAPETAALLFRVAQESLINVGRHARAHEVTLALRRRDHSVLLEVEDDGVGFDQADGAGTGHFGLRVLADLAEEAGATLDVATAPGCGTALRLEVPLP